MKPENSSGDEPRQLPRQQVTTQGIAENTEAGTNPENGPDEDCLPYWFKLAGISILNLELVCCIFWNDILLKQPLKPVLLFHRL